MWRHTCGGTNLHAKKAPDLSNSKNAEMGTLSLNFYNVIAMKPFVIRQSQISENNNRFAKLREMESPDRLTS